MFDLATAAAAVVVVGKACTINLLQARGEQSRERTRIIKHTLLKSYQLGKGCAIALIGLCAQPFGCSVRVTMMKSTQNFQGTFIGVKEVGGMAV